MREDADAPAVAYTARQDVAESAWYRRRREAASASPRCFLVNGKRGFKTQWASTYEMQGWVKCGGGTNLSWSGEAKTQLLL